MRRKKKIVLISFIFLFSLGILSFFVWSFILKKSVKTSTIDNPEKGKIELTTPSKSDSNDSTTSNDQLKIAKIVEDGVIGVGLSLTSEKVVYFRDNKVLMSDFDGLSKNSIGAYPFDNVNKFLWSFDMERALVYDKKGIWSYFLGKNEAYKLKESIDVATWHPNEDKIFYKFYNSQNGQRSLDLADWDATNWRTLMSHVEYPRTALLVDTRGDIVCVYPKPQAKVFKKVSCSRVSVNQGFTLFDGKHGADYLWSPRGDKVLVSYAINEKSNNLMLGLLDVNNNSFKDLNFPASVKKCTWSGDGENIYCGMMSGFSSETILPDDWEEEKVFSTDTFWKINVITGKKSRILNINEIPGSLDVHNLVLDDQEKMLFFIERKTGALYRIKL